MSSSLHAGHQRWVGRERQRRLWWLLMVILVLPGCAARTWNTRLQGSPTVRPYTFRTRLPANDPSLFVVLAFSGGGTRAAAFSYGVLESLRHTYIHTQTGRSSLLDQVDVITSVSGGSYTAAYYGLFGDRIFRDFPRRFLYRNWQGELARLVLRPDHLAEIARPGYNRSDLVAAYLDRTLFDHRTFDTMSLGRLPFVIINATDLNDATTFSFIQSQFDFLCSNVSTYPVADAVMASSAVPGPFAPMALRNYPDCPQRHKKWVSDALSHDSLLSRRYAVALALSRYDDPERMPIVRLVDGGVTDNLGVRGSMMSPVAQDGDVADMAGAFTHAQLMSVRHVLVILANAQMYAPYRWSVKGRAPGLVGSIKASFDAALGLLNTETAPLAKQGFMTWARHVNARRALAAPKVDVNFVILTFNQIRNVSVRRHFNAMPTTFRLDRKDVDALRGMAGQLLERSPSFRHFVAESGGVVVPSDTAALSRITAGHSTTTGAKP